MKINAKKILLAGTAIVAMSAFAPQAFAQTEITGADILADDAAGLTETTASTTVLINSTGAGITLGADGTPSLIMNKSGSTLTVNIDTSGAQNGVVFADNIVETAGNIAMNIVDDNVTFQGNVATMPITVGSSAADPTVTLTVDTANNENITFAATVNAVDAADTVNLTITNTDGGANTVAFTGALGGSTAATALDTIAVGADTTDPMDVTFGANVNAGAINIGGANVADATNNVRFGTDTATTTVTGAIAGGGAGDTNNLHVVGGANVTFNSAIGANIDSITVGADGKNTTAVFKGNVASGPITIGGGATADTNNVTFNATGGDITVTPAVAGGHADDTNNIVIAGGTGKTVTFSAAMGANIDSLTINSSTKLISHTTIAGAVTLGSGSTLQTGNANANSAGAMNGSGTYDVDHNTTWTGNIGNTSALTLVDVAAGTTLTFTGAAASDSTLRASSILLTGAGSTLTLTAVDTKTMGVTGVISTGAAGEGVLNIRAADGQAGTFNLNSNVGVSGTNIDSVSIANATATNASVITVNAYGHIYADALTVGEGDILNLVRGGAQTVAGTINGGAAGDGVVNVGSASVNSNVTFGGAVGGTAGINTLKVFTGSTLNVSNDVTAHTGTIDVEGTLNIDASANTVTVDASNAATLDVDGTVKVFGTSAAASDDVTIQAAGAMTLDGSLSTDIGRTGKTLTLGASTIGATSNTTITAGNQIVLGGATTIGANDRTTTLWINKTPTFNPGNAAGTADAVITQAGTAITMTAAGANQGVLRVGILDTSLGFDNNDIIKVIDSDTNNASGAYNTMIGDGRVVLVDSALIDLRDEGSGAQDLIVKVVYNDAVDTIQSSNGVGVTEELQDMTAAEALAGGRELAEARGNLLSALSDEEATDLAETLAPTTDGGAQVAALNVTSNVLGVTGTRLAALRAGEGTGIAAGNGPTGMRGWAQAFGGTADQDRRNGVDGYEADTYGVAVGVDGSTRNGGNIGVAFSYANTDVDSKNAANTQTDVDSYQLTVYGDMPLNANGMYVDGMLAYSWNDVDSTRFNVGGTGLNANGDYDADQFTAYAEIGRDYKQTGGLTLTPFGLAHWTHYSPDGYTETGAGGAGLVVDPDSVNIFELGLGVDATWDVQNANGSRVQPQLTASYRYDFVGDEAGASARFIGAGNTFNTEGLEPSQHTLNLGAGVKYFTTDNWELSAEYDFEYKADYDAHVGQLRAAYHF